MTAPPIVKRTLRRAPVNSPLVGTLIETVGVVDAGPISEPEGQYMSINCIDTDTVTTMCPDNRGTKDFQTPTQVDGFRFPVYTGLNCRPIGSWDEIYASFSKVHKLKESAAIERALMQEVFTGTYGSATDQDPAIDLTPAGGAVDPRIALAILEQDLGAKYAGIGMIHADRAVATLLGIGDGGLVERSGQRLFTKLGTPLVAGAGYGSANGPDGSPADPGESWMWASGKVTIQAGRARSVEPQMDRQSNQMYALLEQVYVVDVDCYVSAVRVKIA